MKNIYNKNEVIEIISKNHLNNKGGINPNLNRQFRTGKFLKLKKSILYYTKFLPDETKITERIYCIFNNIWKKLKCKSPICDRFIDFESWQRGYRSYCSQKCCNKYDHPQKCWNKGLTKENSEKVKKIYENRLGKSHEEIMGVEKAGQWKMKMRQKRAGKTYDEIYGKERAQEIRRKMRLSTIKRIKEHNEIMFPNYSLIAIGYFQQFDIRYNTKGLYGENEYFIRELGYWPDYINFDLKLIIEWDEEYHYINDKTKEKDTRRQREIQNYFPDFKFIRIREKEFLNFPKRGQIKYLKNKIYIKELW
jgi:hypothetical protein